jgi:hypothetical protein
MTVQQDARSTFDTFVVGPGNRMAAAAARRVAESPLTAYNPLFVYGGEGVGKTHLLLALAHLARAVRPELRILHLGADALVDRVSAAVGAAALDALHDELLETDLLLLDDVHALAGRARTQEALVRVWPELETRTQVVAAARRPPAELDGVDEALRSLLAGGLVVDVPSPSAETARGILGAAAETLGVTLLNDAVEALAATGATPRGLIELVERVGEAQAAAGRPLAPAEVAVLAAGNGAEGAPMDEFNLFLSDISATVEEIVETAPWRRRLAEAILRWEGEGLRTRRLEEALEADTAPDVDGLLEGFGTDAGRLSAIRQELEALEADSVRSPALHDPDRLGEAEAMLVSARAAKERTTEEAARNAPRVDRWYFNAEKVAWSWTALEDRLIEELG